MKRLRREQLERVRGGMEASIDILKPSATTTAGGGELACYPAPNMSTPNGPEYTP